MPKRIERNDRREERRVHRALHVLRQRPLVDQLLQRPQARHVGFRFFDRAVGILQLLTHRRRLAADGDVVRAEAVHQFVHQDVREEHVERDVRLIARGERHLRDRLQDAAEFRLLHVLQHDALRALLANHAFVVRQVVGRGLHAAVGVAGGEDDVHDADRRERAKLRIAQLRDRSAARFRGPAAPCRTAAASSTRRRRAA